VSEYDATAEPFETFGVADKHKNILLYMGIAALVIGLLIVPHLIGMGIFMIAIFFFHSKLEAVRFYKDYSEVKLAIARPRWFIKNKDINSVEIIKDFLHLEVAAKEKTITRKIPLKIFAEDDRKKIISHYKKLAG